MIIKKRTPHQILPTNWHKREKLRDKGQFWTPDWIAKAMVTYAVQDTRELLDPATGDGAFLRALQEVSEESIFHGFDIDENVLNAPIYEASRVFIEKRDFLKNPPERRFPAIVGNPPYIRHHRIDEDTKAYLKQLTTKIIGTTIDGRAGYHVYFLLQALHVLEKNGRLAFIIPADTCEGVFAQQLWRWITKEYCLEAVVTFAPEAAPFPNIDTNALIIFLRNQKPNNDVVWAKVTTSGDALVEFVTSGFENSGGEGIEHETRNLHEAITTGLSREPHKQSLSQYTLGDFANVMRGIATGANEFFFLTKQQIEELDIPFHFFKRTVGRTRDVTSGILTMENMQELDANGRPTFLLSIEQPYQELPPSLQRYLQQGVDAGLADRALIKLRNPWYKTEKRVVPEMLFAYLGRRHLRFIQNQAHVLPLHCLHCVYTHSKDVVQRNNLWHVCNHPDTLAGLVYVSKSYGDGAPKAEPQNLKKLPIPDHLVEQYALHTSKSHSQAHVLSLFNA